MRLTGTLIMEVAPVEMTLRKRRMKMDIIMVAKRMVVNLNEKNKIQNKIYKQLLLEFV